MTSDRCESQCELFAYCAQYVKRVQANNNNPELQMKFDSVKTATGLDDPELRVAMLHNQLDDGLEAHARAKEDVLRRAPDTNPNKDAKGALEGIDASAKALAASTRRLIHNVRNAQLLDAQMAADLALGEAVVAHVEAFGCRGPQATRERAGLFGSRVVMHCCNEKFDEFTEAQAMMARHGQTPSIVAQPNV